MNITDARLDGLFEDWGRWCMRPDGSLGYPRSAAIVAIGSGGRTPRGAKVESSAIEEAIEEIVQTMAALDLVAANVLRAEYGATKDYEYCTPQSNCKLLRISLATYNNALRRSKFAVKVSLILMHASDIRSVNRVWR